MQPLRRRILVIPIQGDVADLVVIVAIAGHHFDIAGCVGHQALQFSVIGIIGFKMNQGISRRFPIGAIVGILEPEEHLELRGFTLPFGRDGQLMLRHLRRIGHGELIARFHISPAVEGVAGLAQRMVPVVPQIVDRRLQVGAGAHLFDAPGAFAAIQVKVQKIGAAGNLEHDQILGSPVLCIACIAFRHAAGINYVSIVIAGIGRGAGDLIHRHDRHAADDEFTGGVHIQGLAQIFHQILILRIHIGPFAGIRNAHQERFALVLENVGRDLLGAVLRIRDPFRIFENAVLALSVFQFEKDRIARRLRLLDIVFDRVGQSCRIADSGGDIEGKEQMVEIRRDQAIIIGVDLHGPQLFMLRIRLIAGQDDTLGEAPVRLELDHIGIQIGNSRLGIRHIYEIDREGALHDGIVFGLEIDIRVRVRIRLVKGDAGSSRRRLEVEAGAGIDVFRNQRSVIGPALQAIALLIVGGQHHIGFAQKLGHGDRRSLFRKLMLHHLAVGDTGPRMRRCQLPVCTGGELVVREIQPEEGILDLLIGQHKGHMDIGIADPGVDPAGRRPIIALLIDLLEYGGQKGIEVAIGLNGASRHRIHAVRGRNTAGRPGLSAFNVGGPVAVVNIPGRAVAIAKDFRRIVLNGEFRLPIGQLDGVDNRFKTGNGGHRRRSDFAARFCRELRDIMHHEVNGAHGGHGLPVAVITPLFGTAPGFKAEGSPDCKGEFEAGQLRIAGDGPLLNMGIAGGDAQDGVVRARHFIIGSGLCVVQVPGADRLDVIGVVGQEHGHGIAIDIGKVEESRAVYRAAGDRRRGGADDAAGFACRGNIRTRRSRTLDNLLHVVNGGHDIAEVQGASAAALDLPGSIADKAAGRIPFRGIDGSSIEGPGNRSLGSSSQVADDAAGHIAGGSDIPAAIVIAHRAAGIVQAAVVLFAGSAKVRIIAGMAAHIGIGDGDGSAAHIADKAAGRAPGIDQHGRSTVVNRQFAAAAEADQAADIAPADQLDVGIKRITILVDSPLHERIGSIRKNGIQLQLSGSVLRNESCGCAGSAVVDLGIQEAEILDLQVGVHQAEETGIAFISIRSRICFYAIGRAHGHIPDGIVVPIKSAQISVVNAVEAACLYRCIPGCNILIDIFIRIHFIRSEHREIPLIFLALAFGALGIPINVLRQLGIGNVLRAGIHIGGGGIQVLQVADQLDLRRVVLFRGAIVGIAAGYLCDAPEKAVVRLGVNLAIFVRRRLQGLQRRPAALSAAQEERDVFTGGELGEEVGKVLVILRDPIQRDVQDILPFRILGSLGAGKRERGGSLRPHDARVAAGILNQAHFLRTDHILIIRKGIQAQAIDPRLPAGLPAESEGHKTGGGVQGNLRIQGMGVDQDIGQLLQRRHLPVAVVGGQEGAFEATGTSPSSVRVQGMELVDGGEGISPAHLHVIRNGCLLAAVRHQEFGEAGISCCGTGKRGSRYPRAYFRDALQIIVGGDSD